jgi:predicted short-subunit dehydrogenase-like oxidoreductase (DUF2520 family)
MKIVLIGSGNVAWNLGKLFVQHHHEVVQIISRNAHTATALAYELNTESSNYFSVINKQADIYIICVNDDALPAIAQELIGINKLVVHTSGTVSADVLKDCSNQYGVLYPLQSLLNGATKVPTIPFLIQANDETTLLLIENFAKTISNTITQVSDDQKTQLHVAAVLVNNFANHLYTIAEQWCIKNNLDFNLLLPLIEQTTTRLKTQSPSALQTGPAVRGDKATIATHLNLIKDDAYLTKLYTLLSNGIENLHKK